MANCMREVDEKQEISLLWPNNSSDFEMNFEL